MSFIELAWLFYGYTHNLQKRALVKLVLKREQSMIKDENIVYHYCSADVFTKIISGKKIRLSDITKSNDSMEILWIKEYIKEIFDEEFDKETSNTKYFNEGYPKDAFSELVEHYSDDFFKADQRIYSYMVCCFSKKGDLLSQWRGYADDASGFSIGFDANALATFGKPPADDPISSDIFDFNKIIYDVREQKARIRDCAKYLISELKPLSKMTGGHIKQQSMTAFNSCFLQLFKWSIFMKNPFFKEEKEWRICYCTDLRSNYKSSNIKIEGGLTLSDVAYYSRKNDVIPYVDLSFDKSVNNIIKIIVIGPKCRSSQKEIEVYMKNYGIVCNVVKSEGTYR